MKKISHIFVIVLITAFFTGCGVVSQSLVSKGQLYPSLYKKHPKSILVLPAKNTTTSVDATDHFRYTITKPLAEKGYYVFPVHLVDSFFKSENLSNVEQIRKISTQKLKEIFNADAILYVDINAWDTDYSVLTSSVDVGISFSLVDASSGKEIWQNNAYAYTYAGMDGNGGWLGLIVSSIAAAVNTTVDYTELASVSNTAGVGFLASGKYHKKYKKDFNKKFVLTSDTNLKDGKLYVNNYFIHGNKVEGKVPFTVRGRVKGYHSFSVFNYNYFNHNGYRNYYITQNINSKKYLKNRFFRYENNQPYLLSNGKKVFVFAESDGTIPFSKEGKSYYFQVLHIIELNKKDT